MVGAGRGAGRGREDGSFRERENTQSAHADWLNILASVHRREISRPEKVLLQAGLAVRVCKH